jgi:N-acetyl-gamma-glutamyl-phosphate reductase
MGVRVAVAGASGYAGGELLRLIAGHPDLELGPVTAAANAGVAVTDVHPHLAALAGRRFTRADPDQLAEADLIFLALPHEESAALAADLPASQPIIDLSASFRLEDPADWKNFYTAPHNGRWVYGLPELPGARERIAAATRVAAPGCHATAAIVALAPLLASGVAEPGDVVVVSASGTSGAGRAPTQSLLASEVMGAVSAYQVGGVHRHTPEIEQALGEASGTRPVVSFTPLLVPMPRGILATCTAKLRPDVDAAQLRAAFGGYEDEPFVTLLAAGQSPHTAATVGSNSAHLQIAMDADAKRAVVVVALDNLGKGAAGQAVQNANLMLGRDEGIGLAVNGLGQ